MKTFKNYFVIFVGITLFSCGSVLKINKNEAKEEQRPILSEKEVMFYDGSDCGYPSQRGLQLRCNYFTPKAHQFLIKQLPSKVFSADIAQI
jgi:hypothetical protein